MDYVKKNKRITHDSSRGKFYGLIRNNQRGSTNHEKWKLYHGLLTCCVRLGSKFKVETELDDWRLSRILSTAINVVTINEFKRTLQHSQVFFTSLFQKSFLISVSYRLQNSRFFLQISKEIGKAWRKSLTSAKRASLTRPTGGWGERKKSVSRQSRSLFSASFETFCLTARKYLNTQKYGLFFSLSKLSQQFFNPYFWLASENLRFF